MGVELMVTLGGGTVGGGIHKVSKHLNIIHTHFEYMSFPAVTLDTAGEVA